MPIYVIIRNSDGKYVAVPGSEQSYTARLENAQTFRSPEKAMAECCVENETVMEITQVIHSLQARTRS